MRLSVRMQLIMCPVLLGPRISVKLGLLKRKLFAEIQFFVLSVLLGLRIFVNLALMKLQVFVPVRLLLHLLVKLPVWRSRRQDRD